MTCSGSFSATPISRLRIVKLLSTHSLYERGFDFADALHLASCGAADRFVTFDREFAKAARGLEEGPAVEFLKA